jgi:glycosyltransferase involved in cell wall biosynthesis
MYGAEAVIESLARTLPSLGIETCVGHVRYAGGSHIFRLEDHINSVEVIPFEHRGRLDPGLVFQLKKAMKRLGIDAIHSHGYKPDFYGGAAAMLLRLPRLATCHLWTRATTDLCRYAKLDMLALRRFDRVIAVSRPILEELLASGITSDKLSLVPNGIRATAFVAGSPTYRSVFDTDAIVFGMACRQVAAKGIDLALRAAAHVMECVPQARLLIAGDGPKLDEYCRLANTLGLAEKVRFIGRSNSIPDFYASLNVFLLPSIDEGLPIALLEAMAAGLPVIATAVGSVDEVLHNNLNGLLIPPGDVAEIESAMLALAASRELRQQLGAAARSSVLTNHTDRQMAAKYADLYCATVSYAKAHALS